MTPTATHSISLLTRLLLFLIPFISLIFYVPFFSGFIPVLFFLLVTRQLRLSSIGGPAWVALAVLVVGFSLGFTNATDMTAAIDICKYVIYSFLIMFFVSSMIDRYGHEALEIIFKGLTALCLIASVYSLLVFCDIFPGFGEAFIDIHRIQGFSGNPNAFGLELAVAVMYLYHKMGLAAKPMRKIVILMGIALMVVCTLLTYSRAAWGMLFLATCCYSLFLAFNKRTTYAIGRLVLNCIGFIIILLSIWLVAESLDSSHLHRERLQLQEYDSERFMINRVMFEESLDHPLGMGPGQSYVFLKENYSHLESIGAIHNAFLRILYEAGFLGEIAYIFFLIYLTYVGCKLSLSSWYLSRVTAVVTALFLGCLLEGMVVDLLFVRPFWMINGMIVGLNILYVRSKKGVRV